MIGQLQVLIGQLYRFQRFAGKLPLLKWCCENRARCVETHMHPLQGPTSGYIWLLFYVVLITRAWTFTTFSGVGFVQPFGLWLLGRLVSGSARLLISVARRFRSSDGSAGASSARRCPSGHGAWRDCCGKRSTPTKKDRDRGGRSGAESPWCYGVSFASQIWKSGRIT